MTWPLYVPLPIHPPREQTVITRANILSVLLLQDDLNYCAEGKTQTQTNDFTARVGEGEVIVTGPDPSLSLMIVI